MPTSWDVPSGMGLGSTVEERRFSAALEDKSELGFSPRNAESIP